jgi:hypothetical protein
VSKLFKLKKWLTVSEAARHLSIVFGEKVAKADVLRLALDGHLKLSVNFVNHARARCGKVVPIEEARFHEFPPDVAKGLPLPPGHEGKPLMVLQGININGKEVLELDKEIKTLDGVYDLPMIGAEALDVEHEYQQLTGGPAVTLSNLEGAFVAGQDGRLCQLQEHFENNEFSKKRVSRSLGVIPTTSTLREACRTTASSWSGSEPCSICRNISHRRNPLASGSSGSVLKRPTRTSLAACLT